MVEKRTTEETEKTEEEKFRKFRLFRGSNYHVPLEMEKQSEVLVPHPGIARRVLCLITHNAERALTL